MSGTVRPRKRRLREVLSVCINKYMMGRVKKTEKDSSLWFPVTEEEEQAQTETQEITLEH